MTEPILNPKSNKEKMVEVLFDKFGFKSMQVGVQALMSLYSEGLLEGLLLDSGDGVTHCIPVAHGYILNS
jgi:actin-related protein